MQTHTPITLESKPALTWSAPSHPAVERTKRWYMIAAAVVFLAAAYGIFSGSWSFSIVSVLAGGMYALIHDHKPPMLSIELHDSGVLFDGTFFRWDELAGFWILRTPAYSELRLIPRAKLRRIVIQTGAMDLSQLRMVLGQRLPELTHMKENILDLFIRICKL